MNSPVSTVLESLQVGAPADLRQQAQQDVRRWLAETQSDNLRQLLSGLEVADPANTQLVVLLGEFLSWLSQKPEHCLSPDQIDSLARLAAHARQEPAVCQRILTMLAVQSDEHALGQLAHLIIDTPPEDGTAVAAALGTLVNGRRFEVGHLFPRLLDGLAHPQSAAAILDVANFLHREWKVDPHPAAGHRQQLESLLHGINHRLEQLQTLDQQPEESLADLQEQVEQSVALAVALCDALAGIGSDTSVAILSLVSQLPHRRLRTEAAAALAKLGNEDGQRAFLEMAREPVARLRVIRYAEELGVLDQLSDQWTGPQARAESELALWLAQPENVGIPPTQMEQLDTRELFWPGFDEPVDCFLFHFEYRFENGSYANRGIAGPLTMAVHACLESLSLDDVYALFAGWTAEHEEIQQWPADEIDRSLASAMTQLSQRAEEQEFEDLKPVLLGSFFSDLVLVTEASYDQQPGLVVADTASCQWWPATHPQRPLSPEDVLNIYKGTRLLDTFNH